MIERILYRCPHCGAEPWLENGRCRRCRAAVRMGADRTTLTIGGKSDRVARWYDAVKRLDRLQEEGLTSAAVTVSTEQRQGVIGFRGGVRAVGYGRRLLGRARLKLFSDRLIVEGSGGIGRVINLAEIRAVTIESHTVILDSRSQGVLFFDFADGAGKRWEDAIDQALIRWHAPRRILEFCPRLRLADDLWARRSGGREDAPAENLLHLGGRLHRRVPADACFERVRGLARLILHAALPLGVAGRENVPSSGPLVLAANHSSFLDAILLAALAPRPIAFMTKNSQFANRPISGVLRWAGAFPVRRYATDVVAVRNARRLLAGGRVLGLFPEGERCWDGRLQPFKRTAIRLLLALGAPVVPVGIAGAYGLMPRWSARVRRVPVAIRFGAPLRLPAIAPGAQSPADIRDAAEQLRRDITTLSRQ